MFAWVLNMSLLFLNTYVDVAFYKCNVSDIENATPYFCDTYIDTMMSEFQYTFNMLFISTAIKKCIKVNLE